VQTRSRLASFCEHYSFVSSIEPTKIEEALNDVDWVNAMHEELTNFTRNQVWELVKKAKKPQCNWYQVGVYKQARSKWHGS
jgi:hypothetical protein